MESSYAERGVVKQERTTTALHLEDYPEAFHNIFQTICAVQYLVICLGPFFLVSRVLLYNLVHIMRAGTVGDVVL